MCCCMCCPRSFDAHEGRMDASGSANVTFGSSSFIAKHAPPTGVALTPSACEKWLNKTHSQPVQIASLKSWRRAWNASVQLRNINTALGRHLNDNWHLNRACKVDLDFVRSTNFAVCHTSRQSCMIIRSFVRHGIKDTTSVSRSRTHGAIYT